jgi:acetaldehyde dehydrogenase/alcohol dehydrogenase
VICPAEQTCIVDEPVFDAVVAEFARMGAVLLSREQSAALAGFAFGPDGDADKVNLAALGQPARELARRAGFTVPPDTKVLLAELPSDLGALAVHPLLREKLMPVLGLVRSHDVQHGIAAAVLVTERGGLRHTAAVYARDDTVVRAHAQAVRTGRMLVNAPTAVGALGGVYNSLTPTLSLGCGTWGGSTTTDNVNYRNLLNVKTVSPRRTTPQWFRAAPGGVYFNAGALANLAAVGTASAVVVTDPDGERRGLVDVWRAGHDDRRHDLDRHVPAQRGSAAERCDLAAMASVDRAKASAAGDRPIARDVLRHARRLAGVDDCPGARNRGIERPRDVDRDATGAADGDRRIPCEQRSQRHSTVAGHGGVDALGAPRHKQRAGARQPRYEGVRGDAGRGELPSPRHRR